MKKIISMGIASAVLALTSVAAFAENPTGAYVKAEKVDGDFAAGASVSIAVKATQDGVEDGELVVEYTGLKFVNKNGALAQYSDETKKIAFSNGDGFKTGDDIVTLEFEVTAAEGEEVSFKITGNADQGYEGIVEGDAITATVGGTTSSDNSDPTNPENPNSGIALAIVPAVIAGAAVVVAAKKRK
ncbi:MAG: hypothetical protein K2N06_11000 [Oscillospiraceae bacterium]|nr:hypothetical protein [Oscillospiraceae bacterium]